MDEKTGKEKGSESVNNGDIERDEKGRFLPGCKGGPGKKKQQPVILADIERGLQDDLKSTDHKVRHAAVKLYLILKKQMVSNKPVTVNPELQALIQSVAREKFSDDEVSLVNDEFDFD